MKSLKFETKSGAVYIIDRDAYKATRLDGPYSPGIDYDLLPDGMWHTLMAMPEVTVGRSVYITFANGTWRLTTPVVSVEEVER